MILTRAASVARSEFSLLKRDVTESLGVYVICFFIICAVVLLQFFLQMFLESIVIVGRLITDKVVCFKVNPVAVFLSPHPMRLEPGSANSVATSHRVSNDMPL